MACFLHNIGSFSNLLELAIQNLSFNNLLNNVQRRQALRDMRRPSTAGAESTFNMGTYEWERILIQLGRVKLGLCIHNSTS